MTAAAYETSKFSRDRKMKSSWTAGLSSKVMTDLTSQNSAPKTLFSEFPPTGKISFGRGECPPQRLQRVIAFGDHTKVVASVQSQETHQGQRTELQSSEIPEAESQRNNSNTHTLLQ
jgi:hypothetical protein